MKKIIKIVITGGPCGGKTSSLLKLKTHFSQKGYNTLLVPESATAIMNGGITPANCGILSYERCEISLQISLERLFEYAAESINANSTIIICDRGIFDNKAWMTDEEFEQVLSEEGMSSKSVLSGYDAVFHLVSAAKGAEAYYTLDTNTVRIEKIEEARVLDEKIIQAWSDHPYFRIIDNSTSFNKKIERLISEIEAYLNKEESI